MPKIKDIIENLEKYKENLIYRGLENLLSKIEDGINDYRKLKQLNRVLKEKKTELNKINKEYIQTKDNNLLEKAKEIKKEINDLEEKTKGLEDKISKIELLLPNWIHKDVPLTGGEENEKPIRYVGEPKVHEKI